MKNITDIANAESHLHNKVIVCIGSGNQDMRGYSLMSLKNAGYKVVLLNNQAPSWETEYITDFIIADLDNRAECIEKVLAYNHKSPIKGVLCYLEPYVELAVDLQRFLHLPLTLEGDAAKVRDKFMMRRTMEGFGMPMPKITTIDVNTYVSEKPVVPLTFPVVLKPRRGHSSIGVCRINSESEFVAKLTSVMASFDNYVSDWSVQPEFIVEEYIYGKEYSVESLVADGEIFSYRYYRKIQRCGTIF